MQNLAQRQREEARRQNGYLRLIDDSESGTKWILKVWNRNRNGYQSVEVRLFDMEVKNTIYETEISNNPHMERIYTQLCTGPIYKIALEGNIIDGEVRISELGLYLDEQCMFPFRLAPRQVVDEMTLMENMTDAMNLRPQPQPQVIIQQAPAPVQQIVQSEAPKKEEPKIGGANNIIVGNFGVGKSTFLNFIVGGFMFMPSPIRDELRTTKPTTVRLNDGRIFMESPGIRQESRRKEGVRETLKVINEGGEYCIIFLMTMDEDNTVRMEDIKLMQEVLDGIKTRITYGIIVNMIEPGFCKELWKDPFAKHKLFGPSHPDHHEPRILYVAYNEALQSELLTQEIPGLRDFLIFNAHINRLIHTNEMMSTNGTPELRAWLRAYCNLTMGFILEEEGPRQGKIDVVHFPDDPQFLTVSYKNSSTTESDISSTEVLKTYAQKGWKQRMFMAGSVKFGLKMSDQKNVEDEAHRKSKSKYISVSILHPRATISFDVKALRPSKNFQAKIDDCLLAGDDVTKRRRLEEVLKESGQVFRSQFVVGGAFRQISKHVGLSDEEMESKRKEKLFQFSLPLIRAASDDKNTEVVTQTFDSESDKFEIQGGTVRYADKVAWAATVDIEDFKTWDVIEVVETIPIVGILDQSQQEEIYLLFQMIPPKVPDRHNNQARKQIQNQPVPAQKYASPPQSPGMNKMGSNGPMKPGGGAPNIPPRGYTKGPVPGTGNPPGHIPPPYSPVTSSPRQPMGRPGYSPGASQVGAGGGLSYEELAGINRNSPAQQASPAPPYRTGSIGSSYGGGNGQFERQNSMSSMNSGFSNMSMSGGGGADAGTCVGIKDFMRGESGDLRFKRGDVIQIVYRIDSNWLYGRIEKREGKFPANHVQMNDNGGGGGGGYGGNGGYGGAPMGGGGGSQGGGAFGSRGTNASLGFARATRDMLRGDPDQLKFRAGDMIKLTGKVDANWYMGRVDGNEGRVPVTHITRM
ncbi:hypothetical protein HDU97_002894 [Phlyctochytrium planicorne]|nr:hypothetical protein HDU97_002894 [Phlyctochytrium planicorne]